MKRVRGQRLINPNLYLESKYDHLVLKLSAYTFNNKIKITLTNSKNVNKTVIKNNNIAKYYMWIQKQFTFLSALNKVNWQCFMRGQLKRQCQILALHIYIWFYRSILKLILVVYFEFLNFQKKNSNVCWQKKPKATHILFNQTHLLFLWHSSWHLIQHPAYYKSLSTVQVLITWVRLGKWYRTTNTNPQT